MRPVDAFHAKSREVTGRLQDCLDQMEQVRNENCLSKREREREREGGREGGRERERDTKRERKRDIDMRYML